MMMDNSSLSVSTKYKHIEICLFALSTVYQAANPIQIPPPHPPAFGRFSCAGILNVSSLKVCSLTPGKTSSTTTRLLGSSKSKSEVCNSGSKEDRWSEDRCVYVPPNVTLGSPSSFSIPNFIGPVACLSDVAHYSSSLKMSAA